ncbi:hypothetical protein B0T13DRAFT_448331 [Neurospora crassa]|nr:hypothetical protein B0T13DRAFT_448331 [Neurospora crassa]
MSLIMVSCNALSNLPSCLNSFVLSLCLRLWPVPSTASSSYTSRYTFTVDRGVCGAGAELHGLVSPDSMRSVGYLCIAMPLCMKLPDEKKQTCAKYRYACFTSKSPSWQIARAETGARIELGRSIRDSLNCTERGRGRHLYFIGQLLRSDRSTER